MDIAYLLSTYEVIQEVMEALYEADNTDVMDKYDWDVTQAAAHLLGQRANLLHRPVHCRR